MLAPWLSAEEVGSTDSKKAVVIAAGVLFTEASYHSQ